MEEHLNGNTALLSLSLVTYQSAYLYDMTAVNALAKKAGAYTLWDLSHATGAVEIDLNASGADMAVGCTYKYLNAGPGAPAFLYVRKELQKELETPIQGWFAHKNPFDFSSKYEKSDTIYQFAAGTPTVLSMIGVKEGASLMQQASMASVRAKSQQMSQLFQEAYETIIKPLGYAWGSPQVLSQRGSHVSLQHEEAWRINQSLIHPKDSSIRPIIPDFRPPKSLRIGFTPLYTSFTEVIEVVERLVNIIENEEYKQHSTDRSLVP
jgi:kynureninase